MLPNSVCLQLQSLPHCAAFSVTTAFLCPDSKHARSLERTQVVTGAHSGGHWSALGWSLVERTQVVGAYLPPAS